MTHQYAIDTLAHVCHIKTKQKQEHAGENRHFEIKHLDEQIAQLQNTIGFLQIENVRIVSESAAKPATLPRIPR